MRNNETGEFELVVGNRQLLSGFFIVVLLFAVAFAMGFVVGENSRSAKAQTEVAGAVPPTASPGEARPSASPPSPAAPAPTPTPTQPVESPRASAEGPPQPTTQPSREVPQPTRELPPARTEPPPVTHTPPATHETRTPAASSAPLPEAPPGSYWQVLATANRDSAQDMVRSLQDKGLPATLGPGPNNLTRVLVGPYRDTAALSHAKSELEAAGLHPVRK